MKSELKRHLGLTGAVLLILDNVIGAGVFFKPYVIYNATGGAPGGGILSWILGGVITLFSALTFAEIATIFPDTGGMMNYLTSVYNEKIGFLAGYTQIIIFYPAFIAGYAVRISAELSEYFSEEFILPLAISFVIILLCLNCKGKNILKSQALFTISKIILLALFIFGGFIKGKGNGSVIIPLVSEDKNILTSLSATLLAVLFTFEGWANIGAISGEIKNPKKHLPKAIIIGVTLIIILYVIINISYLNVVSANELMASTSPATTVALKIFGPTGKMLVKLGIILCVTGAANAFLITGSRVLYALSINKLFPLSRTWLFLNENSVPSNSMCFIGILACIYIFFGSFDSLTDLATFSSWIFYTMTFLAVIILRKKKPNLKRNYKVPLYPFIPLIAILSGIYVLINQLFFSGLKARILAFFSIGITLSGLPLYFYGKKIKGSTAFYFNNSSSKASMLLKNSKDNDVL